jgi:hypothetical protein
MSAVGQIGPLRIGTFERRLREMSEDNNRGQIIRWCLGR